MGRWEVEGQAESGAYSKSRYSRAQRVASLILFESHRHVITHIFNIVIIINTAVYHSSTLPLDCPPPYDSSSLVIRKPDLDR